MRTLIALACLLSGCVREPTVAPQAAPTATTVARVPAGQNRLTEAAYAAMRACMVVEAQSIEHCGSLNGRSDELSAARKAVIAAYDARTVFMRDCEDSHSLAQCTWEAEFDILVGLSRALDPP